jgi:hypothetical protein
MSLRVVPVTAKPIAGPPEATDSAGRKEGQILHTAHLFSVILCTVEGWLEELTRAVRAHNNFAQRMPAVEEQIKGIKDKMEYLHRGE